MSQGRILAIAFIVIGAILALASALADQLGIGAPDSTFGWKQLLGLVLGILLVVAGIILLRQGDVEYVDEDEDEAEDSAVEELVAEEPKGRV
jgi:sulfite exporter TauE/SafE